MQRKPFLNWSVPSVWRSMKFNTSCVHVDTSSDRGSAVTFQSKVPFGESYSYSAVYIVGPTMTFACQYLSSLAGQSM
eukprot:scaffold69_cov198-Alexandrium_tamarense.AAC.81